MITTATASFRTTEGSETVFIAGQSIVCEPTFKESEARFIVALRIIGATVANEFARDYMVLTTIEVDAETGTGSGETAPWFNALQKAVVTKLQAITGNGSTTFTVV